MTFDSWASLTSYWYSRLMQTLPDLPLFNFQAAIYSNSLSNAITLGPKIEIQVLARNFYADVLYIYTLNNTVLRTTLKSA